MTRVVLLIRNFGAFGGGWRRFTDDGGKLSGVLVDAGITKIVLSQSQRVLSEVLFRVGVLDQSVGIFMQHVVAIVLKDVREACRSLDVVSPTIENTNRSLGRGFLIGGISVRPYMIGLNKPVDFIEQTIIGGNSRGDS